MLSSPIDPIRIPLFPIHSPHLKSQKNETIPSLSATYHPLYLCIYRLKASSSCLHCLLSPLYTVPQILMPKG
ncbi:hypothetical protein [Rubritalea tangerina]|uniref:hypothetical protein n=1 Tax=Rubritalea tangerina TaxID=430798 RepID=UPI00362416BE